MSDLVSLEKAAQLLGISTDELNDLRIKNEIFGTRDGSSWKFKLDEIKRVAEVKGINLHDDPDLDFELSDSADVGLSDSAELIGDSSSGSGSGISDVLGEEEDLQFGSSDISLAGSDENVLADDEPLEKGGPSDTGKLLSDSADLELSEDDLFDDDISLQDSPGLVDSSELSSDFEDSDLVLEDSDSSDEPALEAEGGVNLSPNESGIALDEPLSVGGGSDIDDLELPDDDEVIALEDSAGPDASTLLKSDDDFNLTPLEDDALEDSSSGSQVIALEDSAIYTDDSSPTMVSAGETYDESAPAMIEAPGYQPGEATVAPVVIPEAPYTVFNIVALGVALVLVAMGTMVAYDLARNMWQPEGMTLSSTVANFFINLAGFES